MICSQLLRRLAFAGLALAAEPLCAATVTSTWSAATDGYWNANGNWLNVPVLGGFPQNGNGGVATYDAVISVVGLPYTVTLNSPITLEDLTLNSASATINHTAGMFTATGALGISAGAYQLNGGTIRNTVINQSGSGTLLISSNAANLLSGVTVNGDLNLNAVGARTQIAAGTTFDTAHLGAYSSVLGFAPGQTLTGTILFEGFGGGTRLVEMNGAAGTFTIGPTGVIRTDAAFQDNASIGNGSGGLVIYGGNMTLINRGLISSQTSGRDVFLTPTSFTNQGTIQAINGGHLFVSSGLTGNLGKVIVSGSGSEVDFDGSNYIINQALTLGSGTTATFWGAYRSSSAINVTGGTLNLNGTITTAGLNLAAFTRTGGFVNLGATLDNTGSALTLSNATGSWVLDGGTIQGGTLAFADGQSLLISSNSGNTLNAVTVSGDLTLNGTSTRLQIVGGTTFYTAHLAGSFNTLRFAPGQTLTSTILFEGAELLPRAVAMNSTSGNFTIGPTGVIRTAADFGSEGRIGSGFEPGGQMTLLNRGLISSQTSGRIVRILPANFTNEGIAEAINGGRLDITASNWTNAAVGVLRVLNGSTLTFGGNWSSAGALIVDNGTLNLGGMFTSTALNFDGFTRTGGTVNVTGTLNNASSTLTFNNATGSWTLNGGTVTGGVLAFTGGQNLLIAPNSNNLLSAVAVNGDLILNTASARTRIAAAASFKTAHLMASSSSLGFAPGQNLVGTIVFEGAATGTRYVEMNGTTGNFTIGTTGVIRTGAGLGGAGQIGSGTQFGGAMTLINQGLISSQTGGQAITVNPASFVNSGTVEAINGGTLNIPNGYTQTAGTTRLANNSTLSISGTNRLNVLGGLLEGTGTVAGRVNNAGTISPGFSPGQLTITNDLTLTASSAIRIEVGGLAAGTQFDVLQEAGTAPLSLAGTLSVTLIDGFIPAVGSSFPVVVSNQNILGAFSNVANGERLATTDGGGSFLVTYGTGSLFNMNRVVMSNFAIPEPSTAGLLATAGLWPLGGGRRRERNRAGRYRGVCSP